MIKAANSNTISDAYRDAITIAYQYINSKVASTSFDFFGHTFDTPIMSGPIGLFGTGPEAGDFGYARAVNAAGSIYWSHFHDSEAWKKILSEGFHAIRVIKPLADIDQFLAEVKYDTEHGALGYAMDIDHGITVYGELDAQQEPFGPKSVEDLRTICQAVKLPADGIILDLGKQQLSLPDAVAGREYFLRSKNVP